MVHRPDQQCFELTVDGQRCLLEYVADGDRLIATHTYVPPPLRGRGLAEQLVIALLQYCREQGLRLRPQCSYVEAWLRRQRPADLVIDD